ncbi:MAG: ChbG/HpnK family deacetylase [Endomicrobium sp.]|nr:ChbG/HpnK family deacetylase [Endomicrobium sp.]
MIKKLIVNADDFGRNKDNTEAIVFAHRYGVLSSTTVMTEKESFNYAAKLIKENPNLKTGLHIDLDCIFLMREPNRFYKRLEKITLAMKIKIQDAINMQLEKFLKAGFILSHLDSHHHAHMHPEVLPFVAKKAKELNAPIRFHNGYYDCSKFLYRNLEKNVLIPILKEFNLKYPYFLRDKFDLQSDYEVGEVMMHPGFTERWRAFDLAKCCNPELKRQIKENNIQISSFAEL